MTTAETPGSVRPRASDDNRRSRPGAPATTQSTARFQPLRDALAAGPSKAPWRLRIEDFRDDRDAAYVAAADPDTIRALLAALDAANADADRLAGLLAEMVAAVGILPAHSWGKGRSHRVVDCPACAIFTRAAGVLTTPALQAHAAREAQP